MEKKNVGEQPITPSVPPGFSSVMHQNYWPFNTAAVNQDSQYHGQNHVFDEPGKLSPIEHDRGVMPSHQVNQFSPCGNRNPVFHPSRVEQWRHLPQLMQPHFNQANNEQWAPYHQVNPHFDPTTTTLQLHNGYSNAGKIEHPLLNFQNPDIVYLTYNKVVFEGYFANSKSKAKVTFERSRSVQAWSYFLQSSFEQVQVIGEKISDGKYECILPQNLNKWEMTISYDRNPAKKDKKVKRYLIDETYKIYKDVTEPYLNSNRFSNNQWVNNILDHKAESTEIIFEDPNNETGFILLPDFKWDGSADNIHLLAISRKKIKSLRELNKTHLQLLENIRNAGAAAIRKKFELLASEYKVYISYPPSCQHLHVHFSFLMLEHYGEHLLSTVIDNIKMIPDYYQKAQLKIFLQENDELCKKYREKGILMCRNTESLNNKNESE